MRKWMNRVAWFVFAVAALLLGEPAVSRAGEPDYAAAADYSTKFAGRAVLVMRKGEVVFERYDRGWSAEKPHPLASGTKSFSGVMAMMAVQDGLMTLDERACETLTEWKSDPEKSKITVRHLLTLSSGLETGDKVFGGGSGSRLLGEGAVKRAERLGLDEKAGRPENNFLAALGVKMSGTAGGQFEYGPSHYYAFGELLQRKLKVKDPKATVLGYLQSRVLEPVGIQVARIGRDKAGNPNLPGGMLLTAREWAKFGQFVLDDGSVKQADGSMKSLLKPELLAECFEPSEKIGSYGLTWWLLAEGDAGADADAGGRFSKARVLKEQNRAVAGPDGKPMRVYMAAGLGKQRLYVLPQYDLVVVRFAEAAMAGARFDNAAFLKPIVGSEGAGR